MNSNSEELFSLFSRMVIEEYLMKKDMPETLDAFRREWVRPAEDVSFLTWYEVALKLQLPELISRGSDQISILENLVLALIQESSLKSRRQPEVVIKGLATMPRIQNIVASESFDFQENKKSGLNSPNTERKLAIKKALEEERDRTARPKSSDVSRRETARELKQRKTTASPSKKGHHHGRRYKVSLSVEAQKEINRQKELLMNERFSKVPMSREFWIPELARFHQIERNMHAAQRTLKEYSVMQHTQERNMKKLQCLDREVERARVEEDLGTVHKVPCGSCKKLFLYVNLPLKVSLKAILDMRVKWSGALNSRTVLGKTGRPDSAQLQLDFSSINALVKSIIACSEMHNHDGDEKDGNGKSGSLNQSSVSTLAAATGLSEQQSNALIEGQGEILAPRFYDMVPICLFCSQFFEDPDEYRPSFDRIYYNERKAAYLEQKQREKEYWDPLTMSEKARELEEQQLAELEMRQKMQEEQMLQLQNEAEIQRAQSKEVKSIAFKRSGKVSRGK